MRTVRAPVTQSGFTLLETLVALVVLGVLVTGLSQGVRISVNAWHAQRQVLATQSNLQGVEALLRNLLARMDPGGVSGQPPNIVGTAHNLTFTTVLPLAAEALPTREADVSLQVDSGHRLQMLWLLHFRNRIRPAPPPERAVLLQGVDHLDIAYWKDARTGWLSEWVGPTLPRLIRIRVTPISTGGPHIPDIVVAPMRDRWRL
jgi:general secretion pathway protein J